MILGSYFYQSIVHGPQISTTVAVILEKEKSHYNLLNIVVLLSIFPLKSL